MAILLFLDKNDCCGCGACKNACPRNAISMVADEYGFVYPQINSNLCVECGVCKEVCGYQKVPHKASQIACYATAAKSGDILKKSASGGVFVVLAESVLRKHGVVYGVAMVSADETLIARQIRVDSVEGLSALQGSKYVQSDTGMTYRQAENDLRDGRTVLFSGTPCQIAGLYGFLGKNYDNLVTVEVICHGVPNAQMFRDFLEILEKKKKKRVVDFSFRTKEKGQGMNVGISYSDAHNGLSRTIRNGHLYSYMFFFLKSYIYRSNCYSCPFAEKERVADLTIGDFWGFHEEYPVLPSGLPLSNAKGVSCVLVNGEKGMRAVDRCRGELHLMETRFEKIAKHNAQLRTPSPNRQERNVILDLYHERGYSAVEEYYRKTYRKERLIYWGSSQISKGLKRSVKRMIGLIKKRS